MPEYTIKRIDAHGGACAAASAASISEGQLRLHACAAIEIANRAIRDGGTVKAEIRPMKVWMCNDDGSAFVEFVLEDRDVL